MRPEFYPEEKLLRKIHPVEAFWDKDKNRPTSGAFKDGHGLSVDRQGGRDEREAIAFLNEHLPKEGNIVSVLHEECVGLDIEVKYLPVPGNEYHSELHDSPQRARLSSTKARRLSEIVQILN